MLTAGPETDHEADREGSDVFDVDDVVGKLGGGGALRVDEIVVRNDRFERLLVEDDRHVFRLDAEKGFADCVGDGLHRVSDCIGLEAGECDPCALLLRILIVFVGGGNVDFSQILGVADCVVVHDEGRGEGLTLALRADDDPGGGAEAGELTQALAAHDGALAALRLKVGFVPFVVEPALAVNREEFAFDVVRRHAVTVVFDHDGDVVRERCQ